MTTPTSSLHELHRINLIRAELGRVGDEAIRGHFEGGTTAPLTKVNLTRHTTDVSLSTRCPNPCVRQHRPHQTAKVAGLGVAPGDHVAHRDEG
jgi:hypothetical protein